MKNISLISSILVLFLSFGSINGQTTSGYHLVDTIKVGGEGGWDTLTTDPENHRLYVSHATHVVVIDTKIDKVVGDIPNTNGIHGIAIAAKLGRGFTSNGRDNNVTIFDLKTLKTLGTVKTDKNPDIITFDPVTKRVFCFNGGSNNATVIDAEKGTAVGTVAFDGKPEFAVSDKNGTIFVNLEDKSQIVGFDAKTLAVKSHWSLSPCEDPTGLAIDTKNRRLFAACANKQMAIMDSQSGKVIGNVATGEGADGGEFDPETHFAFSPNGEGTLSVVREDTKDKFTLIENVKTQARARTMAIDTKTHRLYLPAAQFGTAPAPTKEHPRPRAPMLPDSFVILVYGR